MTLSVDAIVEIVKDRTGSASQTMTKILETLEGRRVSLSLADGSVLPDCELVSAGRGSVNTVWLFDGRIDRFVSELRIVAVAETEVHVTCS